MLKRNDIILIYDDDQPFAFARIEEVIKALKPDEYHVNVTLMRSNDRRGICYLKGDEFSVGGKEMRFELVSITAMFDSSHTRKNLPQKNEIILIYIDDQPTHFVIVDEIKKADKFGYYNLTLKFLMNPVPKQTLTLKRKFIDGHEWKNSSGKMSRLEQVEININSEELEKFRKKSHYAYLSSEGKKRQKNDIVLIYSEDQAVEYAMIEDIVKDKIIGWYDVKFSLMQCPEKIFTWKLRDEYLNGEEFLMRKQKMRVELVEQPINSKEIAEFYKKKSENRK